MRVPNKIFSHFDHPYRGQYCISPPTLCIHSGRPNKKRHIWMGSMVSIAILGTLMKNIRFSIEKWEGAVAFMRF
jgi:hypothetical protein